MKRAGFTMIELIFVIVILGILSAVALPKFIGVSTQATEGKMKAFVGTLNRTVSPALWSAAITTTNGAVNGLTTAQLSAQIETPDIGDSTTTKLAITSPLKCSSYAAAAAGAYTDAELGKWATQGTTTIGGQSYSINCMDGSMTAAPRFVLFNDSNAVPLVK